jgi:hypothetical protein
MRKLAAVLSLLVALSMCLAAAAPLALADDAAPTTPQGAADQRSAVISWIPTGLIIPVAPGETAHATAVFSSRVTIAHASLVVSFPLNRYLRVEPRDYAPVTAGQSYAANLTVTLPDNATDIWTPPTIVGTVQVVGWGAVYQQPLLVTITRTNVRPPVQWTPPQVRMLLDVPEITPGPPPVTTTEVSFTTGVTITNARIRPTPPLDRVLDISQTKPITLTPGITYTLVMTAHLPTAVTTVDTAVGGAEAGATTPDLQFGDPEAGSMRRLVSGNIQIFTNSRVYAKSLPVTVVFTPVPVPTAITWRPPVVTMYIAAGQSASSIVTLTSSMTIENAKLKVTGPISPYLTAHFAQVDPVTILPRTPYQVTLNVASLATPLLNRPFTGEVTVTDGAGHAFRQQLKVILLWRRPPPIPTPTTTP